MPTTDGRTTGDPELTEQCALVLAEELGAEVPLNDIIEVVARAQRELAGNEPDDLPGLVVQRARRLLAPRARHQGRPEETAPGGGSDDASPPIPFPRRGGEPT